MLSTIFFILFNNLLSIHIHTCGEKFGEGLSPPSPWWAPPMLHWLSSGRWTLQQFLYCKICAAHTWTAKLFSWRISTLWDNTVLLAVTQNTTTTLLFLIVYILVHECLCFFVCRLYVYYRGGNNRISRRANLNWFSRANRLEFPSCLLVT